MANPFKTGDKVVRLNYDHGKFKVGDVMTVKRVRTHDEAAVIEGDGEKYTHDPINLRAAIAGKDYAVPQPEANSGHLADGSSVQKHSAGPIYPCVISLRDKRLKGGGLFDYGVTSPRNHEPVWLSTLEAVHAVADIINKDIAQ